MIGGGRLRAIGRKQIPPFARNDKCKWFKLGPAIRGASTDFWVILRLSFNFYRGKCNVSETG